MKMARCISLILPIVAAACIAATAALGQALPRRAPLPSPNPNLSANVEDAGVPAAGTLPDGTSAPLPQSRPDTSEAADQVEVPPVPAQGRDDGSKPVPAEPALAGGTPVTPQNAPIPPEEPRPEPPSSTERRNIEPSRQEAGKAAAEAEEKSADKKFEPDPRSVQRAAMAMPAAEIACRAQLQALGVAFENRPAEQDEAGCSMPYPISVSRLGPALSISPPALTNCATAETLAKFARDTLQPSSRAIYGRGVATIEQASGYVCRPRNGTRKLSEHAFGNAIDIVVFRLADDTRVDVNLTPDEKGGKFLSGVRGAACGPFKTVLGPGSNADHAAHFHFDLAPRRNGGTYCR